MSGFATTWAWILLLLYGTALVLAAPRSRDRAGFFEGKDRHGRDPGPARLFGSLFIAWIFAKSVTNAANLGADFGLPGAVAYGAYWLSIPVGGLVIVAIRRRTGASSLAEWLTARFGPAAALTFLLAILVRLYNEVWSNTAVVGQYFGPRGSGAYYAGALVFTALTLLYTLKGGLRASIWTDAVHAGLFAAMLAVVLGIGLPAAGPGTIGAIARSGSWTLSGGVDLLLVALLQSLSYPFHDPVLTDRGFLSGPRTTLRACFLAGGLGGLAIVLFGSIGVVAFLGGIEIGEDAPRVVSAALGTGVLVAVNIVMLTSAGSTVDSAFSATAKALAVDAPGVPVRPRALGAVGDVGVGRAAMVAVAVLGSLPLFTDAAILRATTISGTMVLGLAPIFLLGLLVRAPPSSFHLAFWSGAAVGVVDVFGWMPEPLRIGSGRYAALLGANVYGLALATALFALPVALRSFSGRGAAVTPSRSPDLPVRE